MRGPSDSDDVREAAALVNSAIDALGESFAGDRVEASPRVLKGLRRELGGLSDGALPDHPVIPLTASELLVNGSGEPALGNVLKQELRCANDVDLVCAFVGFTGFEPLRDELAEWSSAVVGYGHHVHLPRCDERQRPSTSS